MTIFENYRVHLVELKLIHYDDLLYLTDVGYYVPV